MSIYIAGYILISVIVLFIANFLLRKNKARPQLQNPQTVQTEKAENHQLQEEIKSNEITETDEIINETLQTSANTEPALEYVTDPEGLVNDEENKAIPEEKAEEEPEEEPEEKPVDKPVQRPSQGSPDANQFEGTRGKIIVAVMLGAFVAILNQTLLNVAIPHIMNDLNVSANTVQWLSTGYMLTNGIFIPITAFLIAKLGTRKLLLFAMLAFTIGSFVCSISTSFSLLMVGRVIQAAGAGVIMPLLMTVMLTIFPPEKRGAAMGIMGVAMIFAPAIGPTLSGWLIGHYSWRVLFDIVVPFGILDLIIAAVWMKDVTKVTNPKFDTAGFIFSAIGLGFLLYGFSEAGNDGWSSVTVIVSLLIGIIGLILFVWRELTTDKPMLDIRVFKYDIFALTTVISMVINMAMFAAMILLPIYLQNIRGFTALESGILMLPGAIVMGIMSPISGMLFDRVGSRPLAIIGLIITVLTTWQFTQLTMQTTYGHIMLLYVLRSFGMSFLMTTVMTEGMNQIPLHLASHGTAASNTARTVAGSIGTAFLVTVMSTRSSYHEDNFGNIITSSNGYLANKLNELGQGIAGMTGLPPQVGHSLATSTIYGKVMQQSTISGINDAFVVATGIAAVALILAFFIKRSKTSTSK
ncbi:MFS transporter [Heyndrickxia sporothermodurans]|uniref:DHA2 family efflux MFS transporter permease subunit n=1 Tax=Heyndrickxia sporothermodurans TaxID=46224 RepID=UPI000D3CA9C3|nr:DHA2 family efflux MFS transporter permease subunit [Heyndrickxia sporothermodurans]MBL5791095.1 DHA2 family efflux MFS transporter permease subunit [Heyndrickxia sporothermodurans]MBL5852193.1 DHA2 family efflux MFS transporter permease subunit [Heyndrickxia sporothermodurans]PTY81654.1 MFS transporter [Heyndrickxia sporothermodurans]